MSDQLTNNPTEVIDLKSKKSASSVSIDCVPTGKPYSWQLPETETPEVVALPPEALIERATEDKDVLKDALERTASLFVVLSRNNGYEGRDPAVITDGLQCGTVADLLGFDIDLLARVLLEMRRRGLVTATDDGGLHIDDLVGLDRLSDGL